MSLKIQNHHTKTKIYFVSGIFVFLGGFSYFFKGKYRWGFFEFFRGDFDVIQKKANHWIYTFAFSVTFKHRYKDRHSKRYIFKKKTL